MTNSLVQIANQVIRDNPDKAAQARKRPELAGWFAGQIMKASNGDYAPNDVYATLARRGIGRSSAVPDTQHASKD